MHSITPCRALMSAALVMASCLQLLAQHKVAAPGEVLAEQKITESTGGFSGTLDDQDNFGISVARIGDLDDDGIEDIAVGAYFDDDGGTDRGAVWILFMNTDGTVASSQKISDTQGGFGGTLDDLDNFGVSVAGIGDLDGDLVEDIAVGAFGDGDGGALTGAVWILFLNTDGTVDSEQKISDTQGNFTGLINDEDFFGRSVAGLGDLDGDHIEDIAVGAYGDNEGGDNRGAVWILFLNTNGTVDSFQKISDTQGGFGGTLNDNDAFGISVAAIGDLDGDLVKDLAVGAFDDDDGGDARGAVWILFMNSDGTVDSEQKISDTAGGFGGTLADGDSFGRSVSRLGDINADNVEDLAVGATGDDDGGSSRGAVWILLLNTNGTVASYQKISDSAGALSAPLADFDQFGIDIAGLNDLNADGIEDIVVGAMQDDDGGAGAGAVYVLMLDGTAQLPVELVSFTGTADDGAVVLTWQTASETDNAGFEIQHLVRDDEWEAVAFVEGYGTTTKPQEYVYRLVDTLPGLHRFRLKQIDFDGTFAYSDVIEVGVSLPDHTAISTAYPNPLKERASFEVVVRREQQVAVDLVSPLGQTVRRIFMGRLNAEQRYTVDIDASGLAGGLYGVRVSGEEFVEVRSILVLP